MCANDPQYAEGDRVLFTYNNYDLVTNELLGTVTEIAKVIRIWPTARYAKGHNITLKTGSGKTFVRDARSKSVRKD